MDNVKIFWQKSTNPSAPVCFRPTDTSYNVKTASDSVSFNLPHQMRQNDDSHGTAFPFINISFATLGDLIKSSGWTISRRKPDLTTFHGSWFAAWPHL